MEYLAQDRAEKNLAAGFDWVDGWDSLGRRVMFSPPKFLMMAAGFAVLAFADAFLSSDGVLQSSHTNGGLDGRELDGRVGGLALVRIGFNSYRPHLPACLPKTKRCVILSVVFGGTMDLDHIIIIFFPHQILENEVARE
jgi:hypothetical protein